MFDDMLHLQIAGQLKEKQIMTKATPNTLLRLLLAALVSALVAAGLAAATGAEAAPLALNADALTAYESGFTYQGTLTDNGAAANGLYDFRFELLADGGAVGAEYVADNVTVTDGLFATTVAITGNGMWNGQRRFLRVAARADGEADFVTIGEPTEIQPAPYAFHARQAGRAAEADVATTLANVGPTVVQVGTFNMFQGGTSDTMDFAARGTGMMEVTYGAGTEVGFVYLPVDVPNQVLGFEQKLAALHFCYSGAADNGIGPLAGIDVVQIRQVDKFNQTTLLDQQYGSYQTNENECINLTLDNPATVNGSVWIMFRVIVSNVPLEFGEVKLTFVNQ